MQKLYFKILMAISIMLSLVIIPLITLAVTVDEAVAWCKYHAEKNNQVEYIDKNWMYQCVDFVSFYADVVGCSNFNGVGTAAAMSTYDVGSGWERIAGTDDLRPGDVFINNTSPVSTDKNGKKIAIGHTGVIISVDADNVTVIDQNYMAHNNNHNGGGYVAEHSYKKSDIWGVLRPTTFVKSGLDKIVGTYRGTYIAHDGYSWDVSLDIYKTDSDKAAVIGDCYPDPNEFYGNLFDIGPGSWRGNVSYNDATGLYDIIFDSWIHHPKNWCEESYIDSALSDDGNTLSGVIRATTWTGTKPFSMQRTDNFDFSFDNSLFIEIKESIELDGWWNEQHKGYFKDENKKTYSGIGMYVSDAGSGTAYIKYLIPASATFFSTFVGIDSVWCGTEEYGSSVFEVVFDDIVVYSKSFSKATQAEKLEISIPQHAKILTLRVNQTHGPRGNHACFFGDPMFE